ncbi:MAG TPA: adenylyltransferase/cytidyltransferase family protein [Cyclobacteriaceae bacterium]|jgi:cytidyltransferase-like protein|nr:adenylyltransferase/cytidyltransferase family protein [Cyclobacteriaceae bacterium]
MIVVVGGCFDVLHVGHINMLMFCRQIVGQNGTVIVSIDSDDKIAKDKGADRPIFNVFEREDALMALTAYGNKVVNEVLRHHDNEELLQIIEKIRPDYIVSCDEYRGRVVGAEYAEVIYFKKDARFSSTKIIEACRRKE